MRLICPVGFPSPHLGRGDLAQGIRIRISSLRRFIRDWDCHDRDPAKSYSCLRDFREELHTLFVQGYILCDPDAGVLAAPQGPRKTITQIVLEQCEDELTVQVGSRQKSLWSRGARKEWMGPMADMKSIVGDVVARLDADFTENSLYLCFEAFELDEWGDALKLLVPGTGDVDLASLLIIRLRRKGRRIGEAFSIEWPLELFVHAVRAALREKRDLAPLKLEKRTENRAAWAQALAASPGPVELQSQIGMTPARAAGLHAFDAAIRFT